MYTATFVGVDKIKNLSSVILPFVEFKCKIQNKTLNEEEKIIILKVEGTECYIPVFGDEKFDDIEAQLKDQETELSESAKTVLRKYLV